MGKAMIVGLPEEERAELRELLSTLPHLLEEGETLAITRESALGASFRVFTADGEQSPNQDEWEKCGAL